MLCNVLFSHLMQLSKTKIIYSGSFVDPTVVRDKTVKYFILIFESLDKHVPKQKGL